MKLVCSKCGKGPEDASINSFTPIDPKGTPYRRYECNVCNKKWIDEAVDKYCELRKRIEEEIEDVKPEHS